MLLVTQEGFFFVSMKGYSWGWKGRIVKYKYGLLADVPISFLLPFGNAEDVCETWLILFMACPRKHGLSPVLTPQIGCFRFQCKYNTRQNIVRNLLRNKISRCTNSFGQWSRCCKFQTLSSFHNYYKSPYLSNLLLVVLPHLGCVRLTIFRNKNNWNNPEYSVRVSIPIPEYT